MVLLGLLSGSRTSVHMGCGAWSGGLAGCTTVPAPGCVQQQLLCDVCTIVLKAVNLFWNSFMLYRKSCKDRAPIHACPSVSSTLSVLHCHGTFVTIKESALLLTVNSTLLQLLRKNIWIYFAKIEIAELRGDRLASSLSHLLVFHRIFLGTGNHMYTHADPFYFMACLFFFILLYLERFSASMCLNLHFFFLMDNIHCSVPF